MAVEVQKVPSGPLKGHLTDKVKQQGYALKMVVLETFLKVLLVAARQLPDYYVYYWHLLLFLRVIHQIYSTLVEFVLEAGLNSIRSIIHD